MKRAPRDYTMLQKLEEKRGVFQDEINENHTSKQKYFMSGSAETRLLPSIEPLNKFKAQLEKRGKGAKQHTSKTNQFDTLDVNESTRKRNRRRRGAPRVNE